MSEGVGGGSYHSAGWSRLLRSADLTTTESIRPEVTAASYSGRQLKLVLN